MRKILCSVLAFTILMCNFVSFVFAAETSDLQTQKDELQNQIDEQNSQLDEVQEDLSENLQQVQQLDEKIETSQTEVDKLNEEITNLQTSIDDITAKLTDVEAKYDTQKKLLDDRLIEMYETGETEYLDVILSSRSISDFLSNYFLITQITEYDINLLDEVAEKKNTIDIEKAKLDTQQSELSTKKQNQIRTATILENTKMVRQNYIEQLSDSEREIQNKIDEYTKQFAEINSQILELAQGSISSEYIGGELAWPVPGYTRITSEYGMRTHPITGVYKLHTGVDIGAPMGASFVAANDGIVIKAEYNGAYGNMVIIDHGGGVSTLYAHGSEILVTVGQTVTRNQPVLKVGSTGYSTGAHAHFEVRLNGVVTNPMPYITTGLVPTTQSEETTTEN